MSNPFAYFEEEPSANATTTGFSESADTGEGVLHEPRVPIRLRLKRGRFGKSFLLEADVARCEISGESQPEPIVIARKDAPDRIRMKSRKLIVYDEDGRKRSFRFQRDSHRDLMRARLQTWAKHRWDDAAAGAYYSVSELTKKNVLYPVLHNMIFLTVVQGLFALLIVVSMAFFVLQVNSELLVFAAIGALIYVIPPVVTLALSVALWMRQGWGIYATILLSIFPLILGVFMFFLPYSSIGGYIVAALIILVAVAVIGSCALAAVRWNRQLGRLEQDNRISISPSSGGQLFDENNRMTVEFK